jgi:hypothetical protein
MRKLDMSTKRKLVCLQEDNRAINFRLNLLLKFRNKSLINLLLQKD